MAPKASQKELEKHLAKLCKELAQESKGHGTIAISKATCKALLDSIDLHSKHEESIPPTSVAKVLGVIDVGGNDICCRIDETIFQALVAFFLNVLPAYGSQRGVYLLADALHQGHTEPNEHNFANKKKKIGHGCSFVLLKYFIDPTRFTGMRRWMGVLLLQLLKGCPNNIVYLLKVSGDYSRQLGDLIVNDNNEIIRIVSADIVEAVLKVGMSAVDLWPLDTKPNIYQHFPAKKDAGYWIKDLASYMDYLEEHKSLRDIRNGDHTSGRLYYPQGILVNPDLNIDFGKSLYMLLDNKELTIFSRGSENGFYCSLEMPLTLLVHPKIDERSFVESQRAEALWDMILHPEDTDRCYLNASDTCLKSMCIALPESIREAMKDEIELMAVQASRGHVPRASIVEYAIDDSDESHDSSEVDGENKESPFAKDSPDAMPSDTQRATSAEQVRNSPSEIPSKGDRVMETLSDDERTSSSGFLALLELQHVDESKVLPTTKTPAGCGDEDEDSSRVRSDNLHNISPPKKTRNPTSDYRAIQNQPQVDHDNKLPTVDTPAESSPNSTKSQQKNDDRDRVHKLTPQETLNRPFRAPSKVANGVNSLKEFPLRQVVRSPNKSSIEGQNHALEESPQPPLILDDETSPSEHDASTPKPQTEQVGTKPMKVLEPDDTRQKFTPHPLPGFRDSGLQAKKDNIVANTQHVSQSNDSVDADRVNDAKAPLEGKSMAQRQEISTVSRTQETQKKGTSLKAKQPLDLKKDFPPSKPITYTQVEAQRESLSLKPASHPKSQGPKLLKTNKKSHSTREVDKTYHDQKDVFEIPKDNEQEESKLQSRKAKKSLKEKPNKSLKLPSKKQPKRVAGKSREPALSVLDLQEPRANPRRSNRVANKQARRVNYTEIDEELQNPHQPEEGVGSLGEPVTRKNINTDPERQILFQQTKATRADMTGHAMLSKRKSSVDDEKTSIAVGERSDRGQQHNTSVDNTAMDSGPLDDRARSVGDSKTATSKHSNGVAMAKSLESILADLDTSHEGVDVGLAMDGKLAQDLNANFDLEQDRDSAYQHSRDHRPVSISSSSSKSVSPDPEVESALADEVANQPVEHLIKKAASKNAEESAPLHAGSSVESIIDSVSPFKGAALADSSQRAESYETDSCDQINDVEQAIATNENGKRTSPNAPITPAKRRKGPPKLINLTSSQERSPRTSRHIQLQDAAVIKQTERRKRYTQPSTPPRRSPRLSAKAKRATADLETVLLPLTSLVDEKKSRKPTIVNFGSTGPKNQGRPSIVSNAVKQSHVVQGRTAELHETKEYVRRPTPQAVKPSCDNEAGFVDGAGSFKEDYMNISAVGEVTGDSVEPKTAAQDVISVKTREIDDLRIQYAGGTKLSGPGNGDSISAPVGACWNDVKKNGYKKIENPSRRPCNDLKTAFTQGTLKENKEIQCTSSLPHDQMELRAGAAQRELNDNLEVDHARATKQPEMLLIDNVDLGYAASAESSAIMSSTQRKRKRTAANTIAGQPFIKSPQIKRGIERDRHKTNASDEENRLLDITTMEYPPQRRRNLRYSSQSSRVNLNGSPLASQKAQPVDHIGKVSKGLFRHSMQEQDVLGLASPEPQPGRHSARNDRRADAIALHRPARISSSISKARPSSPEHEEPRYVPHKRNLRTGAYEGMDGSEVIADDQVLPDPFTGKARRVPNGFSKRLQESQIDGREDMFAKVKRIFGEDSEPNDGKRIENEETLVNSVDVNENTPSSRHLSNSSPMLRGDLSSQVETEKGSVGHWLLATKPHYKDLFQVQDFIIEEMRIRLAKQENAIHAVWQQYRDKGNTLLQQWETKRGDEMQDIMENLENHRSHLLTVCGEARDSLNSISNSLRSSPTDLLEKDWHRKQAEIQASLAEI
ncbi:hypothetical protein BP5796_09229 [Coleophoma crateriformis]|uniref:Uncharacterized protein n=1 Tax=Coleophoma crateriformis TaxID=565419 RepID=A0A3D8R3E9_9HELO|nr:hypothetical protein BP5796_09229 [Coleophoma crateriformis]